MPKNILFVILAAVLFIGPTSLEAATDTKDTVATATQPKEDVNAVKPGSRLDKVSREDLLKKINGILSHNPKILESLSEIQKEAKDNKTVFKINGKEIDSFSKDELIAVLKKINPVLLKIRLDRIQKQTEQIARQQQQNVQVQKMAQRQSQMKPPVVYTPPAKQPAPYRPPSAPPAPPKR